MERFTVGAIYVGGALHVAFVVFHFFFWRLFNWREELGKLSPLNAGVVPVMNLCLIVVFLAFAYFSFFRAAELVGTSLGRALGAAVAAFWLLRLIMQFAFFGLRKPASYALSAAFLLLAAIYSLPLWV